MKKITLGSTGITTPQNAFGALPIQRVSVGEANYLLKKAYDGGMTFFDTARAYSDSEEKIGEAFAGMRDKIFIASKTGAKTPETFWEHLHTTLKNLRHKASLHEITQNDRIRRLRALLRAPRQLCLHSKKCKTQKIFFL